MIVIAIIAIIAAIAIPNLLRARASANEASAISSLRTMVSSQAMFYQGDLENDGNYDYAESLTELETAELIDNVLGSGTKSGYLFHLESGDPFSIWRASAVPVDNPTTGTRSFYVDETGVIRYSRCGNAMVDEEEECDPGRPDDVNQCVFGICHRCSCRPIEKQKLPPLPETDSSAAEWVALMDLVSLSAVFVTEALSEEASGAALSPVRGLFDSNKIPRAAWRALDQDQDRRVSFAEILNSDLLKVAATVTDTANSPALPQGLRELVENQVREFQLYLAELLMVDEGDADVSVPLSCFERQPAQDLLGLGNEGRLSLELSNLQAFIGYLNPDPKKGHMTDKNTNKNANRKKHMSRYLDDWPELLASGDTEGLLKALAELRDAASKWTTGPFGVAIQRQVDLVEKLLGAGNQAAVAR
jgi:type II secretory pathway pseudopilin PulG